MKRYFQDESTGLFLTFPDLVVLRIVRADNDLGSELVTVDIKLTSVVDNDLPATQRQIILTNEELNVLKPEDDDVIRFRFVKKAGLSGVMVFTVRAGKWANVRSKIEKIVGYLPISYRGTTETFRKTKLISEIAFTYDDRQSLGLAETLIKQLELVRKWMLERSDLSIADCDPWLQQMVDRYMPVTRIGGTFRIEPEVSLNALQYYRALETVAEVTSSEQDTIFRWEDI